MSKLINFFFSFDKLMKEGLVRAFFWLGLLMIGLSYGSEFLDAIKLSWFAALLDVIQFFAEVLFAVVTLRLLAELAIALFRMNDNLSPDGGKSETADIDPVAEARHAAELAAKRAQEVTKTAVDRTSAATKSAADRSKTAANDLKDDVASKVKPQVKAVPKAAVKTAKKTVEVKPKSVTKAKSKTTAEKKPAVKRAPAKKTATKKATVKKAATKKVAAKKPATKLKREPGMKLDGTPRKKPGPKSKS